MSWRVRAAIWMTACPTSSTDKGLAVNQNTIKPSYIDLVNALKTVLPYAISRVEDMHAAGGDTCPYWKKANAAVERADALLNHFNAAREVTA